MFAIGESAVFGYGIFELSSNSHPVSAIAASDFGVVAPSGYYVHVIEMLKEACVERFFASACLNVETLREHRKKDYVQERSVVGVGNWGKDGN
jgi:hypothetical protein